MSEKKNFAEVVLMRGQDGAEWPYGIDVNGERVLTVGEVSDEDIDDIARDLNIAHLNAVEQREAKLLAAIRRSALGVWTDGQPCWCFHVASNGHSEKCLALREALGPNPPDYVPRAELDAEQAKVAQYAAVMDVLLDVQREPHATSADMTEVVREAVARLEAAGLRKAKRPHIEAFSDDELVVEMKRRAVERNETPEGRMVTARQLHALGLLDPDTVLPVLFPPVD